MNNEQKEGREYYTIDVMHILRTLWHRAWIVVLAGILAAATGFSLAKYVVTPQYSASIMLYVNNGSVNLGSFSITQTDLSASQGLVKTYTVLLKNRTTLNMIINELDLPYNHVQLNDMIQAGSVDGTEVMKVTVTGPDAREAADIANCIAEILPLRIEKIIDEATMEKVDEADIFAKNKVSPGITKYTAIGMILGALFAALGIVISAIMDDTIHDEDYVIQTYDYPILAKIPNLVGGSSKNGDYYYRHKSKADSEDKNKK